jgi:hypothetical protein
MPFGRGHLGVGLDVLCSRSVRTLGLSGCVSVVRATTGELTVRRVRIAESHWAISAGGSPAAVLRAAMSRVLMVSGGIDGEQTADRCLGVADHVLEGFAEAGAQQRQHAGGEAGLDDRSLGRAGERDGIARRRRHRRIRGGRYGGRAGCRIEGPKDVEDFRRGPRAAHRDQPVVPAPEGVLRRGEGVGLAVAAAFAERRVGPGHVQRRSAANDGDSFAC